MTDTGGKIISDVLEAGTHNVAGDGAMTVQDIATRLGKRLLTLPVPLVRESLRLLRALKFTQYGPEQVDFLRCRPILTNQRLNEDFGYIPAKTSRGAFDVFVEARNG